MLHFFFGFHGRIRRTNYFFGALAAMCVWSTIALSELAAMSVHLDDRLDSLTWSFNPSPIGFGAVTVLGIFALWSMLALTVKRWHDVGVTGWFSLLSLPPVAHGVVFLLLCLLPGTTGPNKFGPDPRGRLGATGVEPLVA